MTKKLLMTAFASIIFIVIILIMPLTSSLEYKDAIVTNIWLENKETLNTIKNHNIKYLLVDVGDTGDDGRLLTSGYEIQSFLDFINEYEEENDYSFILLPYSEINTNTYNLTPEFEDNFIEDYYALSLIGFDGIFVDIEPVGFNKREDYLNLLERLRERFGDQKIISVYSGTIAQEEDSGNEWEWNIEFLRNVSDRVDIVAVPVYDTSIRHKRQYQNFVNYTINVILDNEWNSYFFLAVPTHKKRPETLRNAVKVYINEIKNHPDNKLMGMAIFSEWTISRNEWRIFQKYLDSLSLINNYTKNSSLKVIIKSYF